MKYYLFESEFGASIIYESSSLSNEEKEEALIVDELPIAEEREGFHSQLFCSKATGEVWFEYFPIQEEPLEEEQPQIEE